jgi:hypothetical protein
MNVTDDVTTVSGSKAEATPTISRADFQAPPPPAGPLV